MKKKKAKELTLVRQNPVAKYARQFNKAQVFKDPTTYTRKTKHKSQEGFEIISLFQSPFLLPKFIAIAAYMRYN